MRKIYLAIAAMLLIVIGGSMVIWFFSRQPPSQPTPGTITKPTPGVGFGSLNPYAALCKEFQKTIAKIPCEKAVELAVAQYPGKVQKVSIEPVRASAFSSSSANEAQTIDVWMIDILLTTPYLDRAFQKEIQSLHIGIRLDDPNGIYKKPLE